MPCPSSTLPVNTVTFPSVPMRIHASSIRLLLRLPGRRSGCCASANRGARLKERTMPPSAALKLRRVIWGACMSGPPVCLRRAHYRADDAVMGAAAAEIGGKRRAHVVLLRLRVALKQIGRGHDHPVDAIAALCRLLLDKGGLQRVRLLPRAETLDGGDLVLIEEPDRHHAGAHGRAVDEYRAGAALRQPATELGTVKFEIVAEHVKQRRIRLSVDRAGGAVDLQADDHDGSVSLRDGGIDWAACSLNSILRPRVSRVEGLERANLPRRKVAPPPS